MTSHLFLERVKLAQRPLSRNIWRARSNLNTHESSFSGSSLLLACVESRLWNSVLKLGTSGISNLKAVISCYISFHSKVALLSKLTIQKLKHDNSSANIVLPETLSRPAAI